MTSGYDAEQQLLPLTFVLVTAEESAANWSWFIQWLRKEIVGHDKIIVISYQHLGIRVVFERLNFEWQKLACEVVHRYCTQHIAQNVYKDRHMRKNKDSFQTSCRT
jgi:hypothetical protein